MLNVVRTQGCAYVAGDSTGAVLWLHCSELPRRQDVDVLEPGDLLNYVPVKAIASKSPEVCNPSPNPPPNPRTLSLSLALPLCRRCSPSPFLSPPPYLSIFRPPTSASGI